MKTEEELTDNLKELIDGLEEQVADRRLQHALVELCKVSILIMTKL